MIKTKHGEFEIRPITFGERRELHRLEMKVFWDENTIEKDAYFDLLNWCMEKAFPNPEETLEKFDDAQIDEVLNDVYMHYKGLNQKNCQVRISTWANYFGWGNSLYPSKVTTYEAQSPTLGKIITFTEDEIWDECARIVEEDKHNKFSIGQNLYYNLNFFCNPKFFLDNEIEGYIDDYFVSNKFNLPLSDTLYNADAKTIDIFRVISEELTACEKDQGK